MRTLPQAALVLLFFTAAPSQAQIAAFTYQGSLVSGTNQANGSFDVSFKAYNAASGGALLVGPVTNAGVTVTNGVFTTKINFGGSPFLGGDVWLELAISKTGSNAFSVLSPRQEITPSPYALYAFSAGNGGTNAVADGAVGVTLSGTFYGTNTGTFNGNGGGLTNIFLSQNIVPTNAFFDDGTRIGYTAFQLPILPTNQLYYIQYNGNDNGEFLAFFDPSNGITFMSQITPPDGNIGYQSGVFSFVTDSDGSAVAQPLYVVAYDFIPAAGTPVTAKIFAIQNQVQVGNFGGMFDGALSSSSLVPDSALSQNVVLQTGALNLSYDFRNHGNGHAISVRNSYYGSVLNLDNEGTDLPGGVAYTDINFRYGPGGVAAQLRFALGCGYPGISEFPYNDYYLEQYDGGPFWFVRAGNIFGGSAANGNLVWYYSKTSENDESHKMFEADRGSINNFSYVPLIISNSPFSGPTAKQLGAGKSVGIWVSNGVLYARCSADGTNYTDTPIAHP